MALLWDAILLTALVLVIAHNESKTLRLGYLIHITGSSQTEEMASAVPIAFDDLDFGFFIFLDHRSYKDLAAASVPVRDLGPAI